LTASIFALCAASTAASAEDDWSQFSLSTGFEYSSGDYGAADNTNILYVPVSARYETSMFQFRVTVPYLRIEGPGSVLGGSDGGVVVGPGASGVTTQSGIGDVIVAATLNLYPSGDSALPFVELTAKAKVPTANENKGLGTGEFDFTVQADVYKKFGRITPFAMVGYRFRGDPDGFDLGNSLLLSGGATVKVNDQWSVGGVYDWREAATIFTEDASEVSPFIVFKPADGWSVNAYGVFGFSDGSPDTGGGLQIKRTF